MAKCLAREDEDTAGAVPDLVRAVGANRIVWGCPSQCHDAAAGFHGLGFRMSFLAWRIWLESVVSSSASRLLVCAGVADFCAGETLADKDQRARMVGGGFRCLCCPEGRVSFLERLGTAFLFWFFG